MYLGHIEEGEREGGERERHTHRERERERERVRGWVSEWDWERERPLVKPEFYSGVLPTLLYYSDYTDLFQSCNLEFKIESSYKRVCCFHWELLPGLRFRMWFSAPAKQAICSFLKWHWTVCFVSVTGI